MFFTIEDNDFFYQFRISFDTGLNFSIFSGNIDLAEFEEIISKWIKNKNGSISYCFYNPKDKKWYYYTILQTHFRKDNSILTSMKIFINDEQICIPQNERLKFIEKLFDYQKLFLCKHVSSISILK